MTTKDQFIKSMNNHIQTAADEKAGYPPNCNEGYTEKDGKCIPIEDLEEAESE